jgi:hypothetical protein
MKKTTIPETARAGASAPPVIVFPLFGQPRRKTGLNEDEMEAEQKRQRKLIRDHSGNPGVRAMFNMLERIAARLQADGIQPEADRHVQGQACGAGYAYNVIRTVLEGTEDEEEEEADE